MAEQTTHLLSHPSQLPPAPRHLDSHDNRANLASSCCPERPFHPSHLHQPARVTSPAPFPALPWPHVGGDRANRKLTQLKAGDSMLFELPELPHLGATWEPGRRGRGEGQDTQSEAGEDLDQPWSSGYQPTPQTQLQDPLTSPSPRQPALKQRQTSRGRLNLPA